MCPFEILHFLPFVIIIGLLVGFRKLSNFFVLTLILSLVGLFAGLHSHEEHHHFFGLSDPCFSYAGVFAISLLNVMKKLRKKFIRINAR